MATDRERAEAHAFERRRLVAAYLSGAVAPGREPAGPVRALVVGLVLAALIVAGGAFFEVIEAAVRSGSSASTAP